MPMEQFIAQYGMWIYLVFIVAIFYFILIRPQKKKDKEHKNMVSSLKKGDTIITIGGFYAKVVSLKDNTLTVMLGDSRVKLEISAVKAVIKTNDNAESVAEEEAVAKEDQE